MNQINPKHNLLARRKNQGKWIGGVFINKELLERAQRERIGMMIKERIWANLKWYQKIYLLFKRLWRKIRKK